MWTMPLVRLRGRPSSRRKYGQLHATPLVKQAGYLRGPEELKSAGLNTLDFEGQEKMYSRKNQIKLTSEHKSNTQ